jgi:uncharacterized protein YbjT (DUF2867 family)
LAAPDFAVRTCRIHRGAAARDAQTRVPRLLHMSALNADAERGASHYLRTKGEAEQLLRAAGAALDWTIFQPSVIFGPGDSLTNRFAALLRLSAGVLPLARAGTRFAPIYVGDVTAAFAQALPGGATSHQSYQLCGPEVLTLEQIVRVTAQAAHLPCHILRLPDGLARVQAALMQLLPGKPFSTDNYRSLLTDSVCQRDGCRQLGPRQRESQRAGPIVAGAEIAGAGASGGVNADGSMPAVGAAQRAARRGIAPHPAHRGVERRQTAAVRRQQSLETRHAIEIGADRSQVRVVQALGNPGVVAGAQLQLPFHRLHLSARGCENLALARAPLVNRQRRGERVQCRQLPPTVGERLDMSCSPWSRSK